MENGLGDTISIIPHKPALTDTVHKTLYSRGKGYVGAVNLAGRASPVESFDASTDRAGNSTNGVGDLRAVYCC